MKNGPTESRRFVVLDFYRYVAAIGVVLFHAQVAAPGGSLSGVGSYGLFVDMFFILSGFVICFTYRDRIRSGREYWTFMVKRLARIYPLHILVLLIFVLSALATGSLASAGGGREVVVNALLLQAWGVSPALTFNTPAWSISAELGCYLVFPAIAWIIGRTPLVVSFGAVGLAYIVGGHGGLPIWDNGHSQMLGATFDFGVVRGLVGFVNGAVLCRLYTILTPRRFYLPLGIGAFAIAILFMNVFAKGDLIVLLMAGATVATALGERAAPLPAGLARVLEWFGNTSYAIYMIHWGLLLTVIDPVIRSAASSEAAAWAILLAVGVVLTGLGQLVYRTIETPARRSITSLVSGKGGLARAPALTRNWSS